jgi:hypothetical protein
MFEFINNMIFDSEYINTRRLYFETVKVDKELAEFFKFELLKSFENAFSYVEYFVDMNKLFEELKLQTPHQYHNVLKNITQKIFCEK